MPIYEYSCRSCKHKFEKLTRVYNRHMVACPKCGTLCELKMSRPNLSTYPVKSVRLNGEEIR